MRSGKQLLDGHIHRAHFMAFSPDGKLLAVGGNYSEFSIYDAATGKPYWDLTLEGHGDSVLHCLEFSRDGKRLVSAPETGCSLFGTFPRKRAIAVLLQVPDSRYATVTAIFCEHGASWPAIRTPGNVAIFKVFDKEPIDELFGFSLSPDGANPGFALGIGDVWLLDLDNGKIKSKLHTEQKRSVQYAIRQMARSY